MGKRYVNDGGSAVELGGGAPHVTTPMVGSGHVVLTTPGAANTKAATWVQLVASLAYDAKALLVSPSNGSWGSRTLTDIAIGAGGAEVVIPGGGNLLGGLNDSAQGVQPYVVLGDFPAGSRIAAKCQASRTDATPFRAAVLPIPSPVSAADPATGQTLGAVTADSGGTQLTAGSGGAKGTWVSLGALALGAPCSWINLSVWNATAGGATLGLLGVDLAADDDGTDLILTDVPLSVHALGTRSGLLPVSIPDGTELFARISSTTNAHAVDLIGYAFT